jgi:hypothetical protein
VDALETIPEATALADWIALHQRRLTTIYITHGHGDRVALAEPLGTGHIELEGLPLEVIETGHTDTVDTTALELRRTVKSPGHHPEKYQNKP